MRLVQGIGLVLHLTVAGFLAWIGANVLQLVFEIQSGYKPPVMDFIVMLGIAPLALALAIVVGVVLWLRSGRPGLMLLADAVTWLAAWTLLVPLVFLPGDRLTVVWLLAPACMALAVLVSRRSGSRSAADGGVSVG